MLLFQHKKQSVLPEYAPYKHFERWLGRKLTRAEQLVIGAIEARGFHHFPSTRIVLIDPPGIDSTQILKKYLLYLSARNPMMCTHIVAQNKQTAKDFAAYGGEGCTWSTYLSWRKMRGSTYHRLLFLNANRYKTRSPFCRRREYRNAWPLLMRNLVGPICIHPDHLVIIHFKLSDDYATAVREFRRMRRMMSAVIPRAYVIMPDIVERMCDLQHRIEEHNRVYNRPVLVDVATTPVRDEAVSEVASASTAGTKRVRGKPVILPPGGFIPECWAGIGTA